MSAFSEKRLGRVLLSEAFVTGDRSGDVFKNFAILGAMPRYNEPGIIAYYGAHPDFEPTDLEPKNLPYYDPYWGATSPKNMSGFYFKRKDGVPIDFGFATWMKELNVISRANLGGNNVEDFDDYDWRAEYDSGHTPADSFEEWRLITDEMTR